MELCGNFTKSSNTKTVEGHLGVQKSFWRTSRSEMKSAFSLFKLTMTHGKKNTEKSFVRENKFHAYLTRETLPAEERVHIFHNHGKKSSCQTFADASMTKVVPKSYEALDGIEEKG